MVISRPTTTTARGISLISYLTLSYNLVSAQFDIDNLDWNENLSCHQCIRSGLQFVYENIPIEEGGQYFKDIPRDSDYTGFCCDGNLCEEEPEQEDPDIAEMWEFFTTEQPQTTADIELFMDRINRFEGKAIYNFFVYKLISVRNLDAVIGGNYATLGALSKNLRNRVLYHEMKKAVGAKMALEYMDLISDLQSLESEEDSAITSGEAENSYYSVLKEDLYDSATEEWGGYSETEALDKIHVIKKRLLWNDIGMFTSTEIKEEIEALITEVEAYEGTSYSNFYMKYLWKYYGFDNDDKSDNYMRALYELRTRVLNIRMNQLKGLEDALTFNIHLQELKYYDGREDRDEEYIEVAGTYNTFVSDKLTAIGSNTDSDEEDHVEVADDIIEELNRKILWDFFAHNTSVADKLMYRDVYIGERSGPLNTRLSLSEDHQTVQEDLLQTQKDLINEGQDDEFQTIWDDFKLKIMYMQFKADLKEFNETYDATDSDNTLTLLFQDDDTNTIHADDELMDTIFPKLTIDRDDQIALEESLWPQLDAGDGDDEYAYITKFFEKRQEYLFAQIDTFTSALVAGDTLWQGIVDKIPGHWLRYHRAANADPAVPLYYDERVYAFDAIIECVDNASTRTFLERETIELFEQLYADNITTEYDEEATPIAEDDNDTSFGFGFIEKVWKKRYTTTMAKIESIAQPADGDTLVVNMLNSDPADNFSIQHYKAFRNNNRYWFLTSTDLRDTITAEMSDSVLSTMWPKYAEIVGELFKDGIFTDYAVSAGSLTGDGRGTVDNYLFLYAVDDTGYRAITEAEWLVDVYDMLLKKWIKILTEDKLSLMNEKDPADYTDDIFDENDTDGYPGPTVACLWDEMTDLTYDGQTRRDYVYDLIPSEAKEEGEDEWTDALAEDYMLAFYLDRLEKRFAQTFGADPNTTTFTEDEQTEWNELITEVRDYPDWATAEHIATYELNNQDVYLRAQRYVKMTQTVTDDVCTATTDQQEYDDYRDDLREWLLWSFCAALEDIKDDGYKGDDSLDFSANIDDEIDSARCHTLNFMLDYLVGSDAPHTEEHDTGHFSNNYEQDELKLDYITRLDSKKTDLVAKLDAEFATRTADDTDPWDEFIAFRDEFELIFGEVEVRINMEFSRHLDSLVDGNVLTKETAQEVEDRLMFLRKSADFDGLVEQTDQTYAERQAIFLGADWLGNLEAAADNGNDDDNLMYFTSLVDSHYLALFFSRLQVLESGTLESSPAAPMPVVQAIDHDGETDVFYGGISIPTYSCAPYNDSEDNSDALDTYFEINSDADDLSDAIWLTYWTRQLVAADPDDYSTYVDDLEDHVTYINDAHDVLVDLITGLGVNDDDEYEYNFDEVNEDTGSAMIDLEQAIHDIWIQYIGFAWDDRDDDNDVDSDFTDVVDYDEYKGRCEIIDTDLSGWELSLSEAKNKEADVDTYDEKFPKHVNAVLRVCEWVYETQMNDNTYVDRASDYEATVEFTELDFMNGDDDDHEDTGEGVLYEWCKNYYDESATETDQYLIDLRVDVFKLWGSKVYNEGEETEITGSAETYADIFEGYLEAMVHDTMFSMMVYNENYITIDKMDDLFDTVYGDQTSDEYMYLSMNDDYNVSESEDYVTDDIKYVLGWIATQFSSDMVGWEELSTDVAPDIVDYAFGDEYEKFNDRHSIANFQYYLEFNDSIEVKEISLDHWEYLYENFISIDAGTDAAKFKAVFNNLTFFKLLKAQTFTMWEKYIATTDQSSIYEMPQQAQLISDALPKVKDIYDLFLTSGNGDSADEDEDFTANNIVFDFDDVSIEYEDEDISLMSNIQSEYVDTLLGVVSEYDAAETVEDQTPYTRVGQEDLQYYTQQIITNDVRIYACNYDSMDGNGCDNFEDSGTDVSLGEYVLQFIEESDTYYQTTGNKDADVLGNGNDDVYDLWRIDPTDLSETNLKTVTAAMNLYTSFHSDLYTEIHNLSNASGDSDVDDYVAGTESDLAVDWAFKIIGVNNGIYDATLTSYWGPTWPNLYDTCRGIDTDDTDCTNAFIGDLFQEVKDQSLDIDYAYEAAYEMLKLVLKFHINGTNNLVSEGNVDDFYDNWVENDDSGFGTIDSEWQNSMMENLFEDDDRYDELHDNDYGLLNIQAFGDVDSDTALWWMNSVNQMWIAEHFVAFTDSMKWIDALDVVLASSDDILATTQLNEQHSMAYSTVFWRNKWSVTYTDFADDDNEEYVYATDAFKYVVQYAISSSEATNIQSAIDEDTTPSISDVETRIEMTVDSGCADERVDENSWYNTMTDTITVKQTYICWAATWLEQALEEEEDDCEAQQAHVVQDLDWLIADVHPGNHETYTSNYERAQDRLVTLTQNNYDVVYDSASDCDDLKKEVQDHTAWERFRVVMGETEEFGYTFDYYDELFQLVDNSDSDDIDWEYQAYELQQCDKIFFYREYTSTLQFEDFFSIKRCFNYILGRARARYDETRHEDFYAAMLEYYEDADTVITLDEINDFRRKILIRSIHDSLPDATNEDDYTAEDLWDDLDTPADADEASDMADIMIDFLDQDFENSFPDVDSPSLPVIVGAPKTKEFTIADLPLEAPIVGARTPMVKQTLTASGKPSSEDITDQLFKLAACPTKREKCGPRTVDLVSHRSQPVELKINDFTEQDSCTWFVRTQCGLPTITVTDITKGIADHLEVAFIEYEVANDNLYENEENLMESEDPLFFEAEPKMYSFPERQNVGALQSLKFRDQDDTAIVDGSSLYSSLNSKRIAVAQYREAAQEYNNLRLEYNAMVNELQNQIDSAILAGKAAVAPQDSILDTIFGWFSTEEEVAAEVDIPPLIKLPPRPLAPEQPRPYDGATINLLEPELGYGLLSAGKISLRSHHGVKKFFGVGGQGHRTQENLSYTLDRENAEGTCRPEDALQTHRYYYLSVYPRIQVDEETSEIVSWNQRAERLKFTVQSEFINSEYDFSVPESTQGVIAPLNPPTEARVAEYFKSFEQEATTEEGASKLLISASASIIALAALTLY